MLAIIAFETMLLIFILVTIIYCLITKSLDGYIEEVYYLMYDQKI